MLDLCTLWMEAWIGQQWQNTSTPTLPAQTLVKSLGPLPGNVEMERQDTEPDSAAAQRVNIQMFLVGWVEKPPDGVWGRGLLMSLESRESKLQLHVSFCRLARYVVRRVHQSSLHVTEAVQTSGADMTFSTDIVSQDLEKCSTDFTSKTNQHSVWQSAENSDVCRNRQHEEQRQLHRNDAAGSLTIVSF